MADPVYRSDIESGYYRDQFRDLVILLRKYILDILSDLYEDRIEQFVRKLTERNRPLVPVDFLVDHTAQSFQNQVWNILPHYNVPHNLKNLKDRLRQDGNEQIYKTVFDMRVQNMNAADKKEFCLNALQYSDISAVFNIIEYMPLNPNWIRDRFRSSCGLEASGNYQKNYNVRHGEAPRFKTLANDGAQVREARNLYIGHEKSVLDETNTLEFFEMAVKQIKKVTAALQYQNYQENREQLISSADQSLLRSHYAVLTFANLKASIPGFKPEVLRFSNLSEKIDFENQKIYLTKSEEVKELFATVGLLSDFSRELAEKDKMVDFLGARLSSETESESLPVLSKILTYRGGFLKEEQAEEILQQSLVFIDQSVWLNKRTREFAAYQILPKTAGSMNAFVDWGTRTEMFMKEKTGTDEEKTNAAEARNMISFLHGSHALKYGPVQEFTSGAEDNLIYLAKQNSDRRIVIITQKTGFIKRLVQEGLTNVLPVSIAGTDLVVRQAGTGMVWPFAVYQGNGSRLDGQAEEHKEKPAAKNQKRPFSKELFANNELVKDSGNLLEITQVPDTGSRVYGMNSRSYILMEEAGYGGEGTIYKTGHMQAVKIYHRDRLTEGRKKKLELMTSNQPEINGLCWPKDCVYTKDGTFAGYVMPLVPENYMDLQRSVLQLGKQAVREQLLPGWDRIALVRLCLNICYVLKKMHESNILMGDVNPNNIMVDITSPEKPWIRIVDCDSMQLAGYPSPVGMELYTSPEIYQREGDHPSYDSFLRTQNDELYAAASLMFRILMLNGSPFESKGMEDISSAIRGYRFAYRYGSITGEDVPDGPYGMIWNNMPKEVRNYFGSVFTGEHTVTLGAWISALKGWLSSMMRGSLTNDLIPNRYYENEKHEYNTDFVCEECGCSTNLPKKRYIRYKETNMPMLCPACSAELRHLEYTPVSDRLDSLIPSIFSCELCGKMYRENYYRAWLIGRNAGKLHRICPQCGEKEFKLRCVKCRSYSVVSAEEYAEMRGSDYICGSCSEMVDVTCSECGKNYRIRKYMLDDLKWEMKKPVCSDCRSRW